MSSHSHLRRREIQTNHGSVSVRRYSGPNADELFLLCRPSERATSTARHAEALYEALRAALDAEGADGQALVHETTFLRRAGHDAGIVVDARRRVLGQTASEACGAVTTLIGQPPLESAAALELAAVAVAPHRPDVAIGDAYREWWQVFWREYDRLREDLGAGRPTFLDPYAASAPAEFFAVVTEAFFEQPRELEMQHAGLYQQLRRYNRVDPARW